MPARTAAASTATGLGGSLWSPSPPHPGQGLSCLPREVPPAVLVLPRAGLAVGSCGVLGVRYTLCPRRPRSHLLGLKVVGARLGVPKDRGSGSLRSIRNSVEISALNYTFSSISVMQYILGLLFFFISIYNACST